MAVDPSNPYWSGETEETRSKPSSNPSIEDEPHLRGLPVFADPSEERAERTLLRDPAARSEGDEVERSVWDEPALRAGYPGAAPENAVTYSRWLERMIRETTAADTWRTTLLVALSAGPWGILGALMAQLGSSDVVAGLGAIVLAPVTEEITKVALALWIVEKRPYRFKSPTQLMLCAAAGGLCFAVIENLIYLNVYLPGAGGALAAWRWTICTALHLGCSLTVGVGLVKIWSESIRTLTRPELARGMPWFAGAMIMHGAYNALAMIAESAGWLSFR